MGLEENSIEETQFVKITTLREQIRKLLKSGNKVLWRLQPEVKSSGLLEKLSEQDVRLEELKFAVFTSEVAYNMEMTELVNLAKKSITWIDPLAKSTRRAIAKTVEGVKRTSNTFLGNLEKEWTQSRTITMEKIYQALSEMIPQFQNYVTYCMHQEELRSVIQNALFMKPSLQKTVFSTRMNVERVLLPLQRLQTLRLLLQEIRHELIPTTYSNENNSCKNALYKVTQFLDECYEQLALLKGPEYTEKLNDALENNAYHYGLGIALKAENGNDNINNLITFHESLQENYIPPRITRHASFLPSLKQNINDKQNRHSYESFSSTDTLSSKASAIHDEYLESKLSQAFKEACTQQLANHIDEKRIREGSNASQDSGISCNSWANILIPSEHFNKLSTGKIEHSDNKLSDQYFSNGTDENKSHADECYNSDCVFCQNNINECYNYILIGEIEHLLKCNGNGIYINQNHECEVYNGDKETNESKVNIVPALILQQLFIASPKLHSKVNNQQMSKQEPIEFSKLNATAHKTNLPNNVFFNRAENPVKDVHILERYNNTPRVQKANHEQDLILFPDLYEEIISPKNAKNISSKTIKASADNIYLTEMAKRKLETKHFMEEIGINSSKGKDETPALHMSNKLPATTRNTINSLEPSHFNSDEENEQNSEPEDHIYEEPLYYSMSSSTNLSDISTPKESDALSIKSGTSTFYIPAVDKGVAAQKILHISDKYGESYEQFNKTILSLYNLSASLAEDNISRKTLLFACEDVPLYHIFTLDQDNFSSSGIEDDSHIYEDIDTITSECPELDRPKEMNVSRPIAQCQRLRWIETSEVINSNLTDKLNSTEIALQETKFEIITSEVSYFKSLCVLEAIFMENPLLAEGNILSQKDYETLFSTIQKVKICSQQFLAALTASFQDDFLLNNLCKVVLKFVQSGALQVYIDYCMNHIYMEETLQRLRDTNPDFKNILERLEEDSACQMCSLQSFLTFPVQRVTRLPLLIRAVLKYFSPGHSEYNIWKMALAELNKLVESCNNAAGEVKQANERLITPTITPHIVGKKKSKRFWKKFKSRKIKI